MRHNKHKYKLGVDPAHRKSMMKNLASSLIEHKRIKTTKTRCKALKIFVEKLVTIAKVDTVANRRQAYRKLNNKDAVKSLFTEVGPMFKERNGGYTRILKLSDGRVGDNAQMAYISFVD